MDGQINLFGEYQEYPKENLQEKGRPKYKTMQDLHSISKGHTCGSCIHCRSIEYSRKYYKCDIWFLSHSSATDIRLKDLACGLWNDK